MNVVVEQIVNGLMSGCIYALIAIGLTMVYGILHVINLAHGEIYMIGAFVAFFCYAATGSYACAVAGAVIVTALVGVLIERLVFRPLVHQPRINSLIASVGLSLVLSNIALALSGGSSRFYVTPLASHIVHLGFMSVAAQRLLIVAVTLVLIGVLTAFYQWSRLGKALRAAAQDLEACSLVGIEPRWLIVVTFMLGAGLAGLAGSLLSPIYTITYDMGLLAVMKAFAVVIVGGFGNIPGTILAGFLLGIAESVGGGFVSPTYQDSIVFVILAIALMIRPTGLIGERVEENI
ncbi:MAG TPA: branched-chain amino acid ABC transporter permease [Hyphomicrobiaceae bacterium]|nr:branched-chain amino acid ABC transporter permease [Hyphomicrobiaceae bacterium]